MAPDDRDPGAGLEGTDELLSLGKTEPQADRRFDTSGNGLHPVQHGSETVAAHPGNPLKPCEVQKTGGTRQTEQTRLGGQRTRQLYLAEIRLTAGSAERS